MMRINFKNNIFFFTTLFILLIISSFLSYENLSYALYFNEVYIQYANSIKNFLSPDENYSSYPFSTFPLWGYGLIHWIFGSSKLLILIFQQLLNFYTIYLVDKFLKINYTKCQIFFRRLVLLALPYFFFHTQLWPKSISSSLLIIGIIQLFEYFNSKNKFQLVISSLIFGIVCNFRSDYFYFIITFPLVIILWELLKHKRVTTFSISFVIVPLLSLILLVPWGLYTYSKTKKYHFTTTNTGHSLFIGLGQLPNNKWGITPRDDDMLMDKYLSSEFGAKNFLSTNHEENKFLKKRFFNLIKENPVEWIKKCSYTFCLIFMDPFYVGNVGNFQLNGMSNINEIRMLEKSVYEFDFKNFSNLIINTSWKFSTKEICALIITILAKIIGLVIYFVTIFMAFYLLFFDKRWFMSSAINTILSFTILYQLLIQVFVFHMPVYNTSIYLIYLIFISLMFKKIFLNSTIK